MKARELRPCDRCGGPIEPVFCRVSIDGLIVDRQALKVLAAEPEVLRLAGDPLDVWLCLTCASDPDLRFAELWLGAIAREASPRAPARARRDLSVRGHGPTIREAGEDAFSKLDELEAGS